jgi:hypothetical protein
VPTLTNTPRDQTVFRLAARKSFALGLEFVDLETDEPISIEGCSISLVAKKQDYLGGAVQLDLVAELIDDVGGVAQFNLQASDLDLDENEYPFSITFLSSLGYSTLLCDGVIDIQQNAESAAIGSDYTGINPSSNLAVYLNDGKFIKVRVASVHNITAEMLQDWRSFGIHSPSNYGATMNGSGVGDDAGVTAALAAIAAGPVGSDGKSRGTLRIPPKSNLVLSQAHQFNIKNTHLVIDAANADIRTDNAALPYLLELYTDSGAAGQPRPRVFGGQWTHTSATAPVFRIRDIRGAKFSDVKATGFIGWQAYNDNYYVERLNILDCEDRSCTIAVDFVPGSITHPGDDSKSESFKACVVRNLQVTGGVANMPKIRCRGAVYDSVFDGIFGNISDDVVVMYLSGGMRGTEIKQISVEANSALAGHTNTGWLFEWGDFTGTPPTITGNLNLHNNILFEKGDPPFGYVQPWNIYGVARVGPGREGVPSWSFRNDPDSGFYSSAADFVALALGGSKRAEFAIDTGLTMTAPTNISQVLQSHADGDGAQRFKLRADGFHQWGDGTAVTDLTMRRRTAGVMEVDGALEVTGTLKTGGVTVSPANYQPVDADLTAIAALATTAYGRSLLEAANAAAARTTLGLGTLQSQPAQTSLPQQRRLQQGLSEPTYLSSQRRRQRC